MLMIPRPSPNSDTIQQDKAAVLVYLRMRHKDPYRGYVLCGVVRPFLSFYFEVSFYLGVLPAVGAFSILVLFPFPCFLLTYGAAC